MMRLAAFACLAAAAAFGQTNLEFREGATGQPPPGWFVVDGSSSAHFTASRQTEGCRGDLPCAVLASPDNLPADGFGTLMQSIAAQPLRGKNILLRAWIRVEAAGGAHAQMLLHVSRPNLQPGFVDHMADRPITGAQWQQFELRGEVSPDAESIGIGVSLYGAGRVWIGGVEFGELAEQTNGPAVEAARDAIAKQYDRMDAAFVRHSAAEIAAILMPGAEMRVGTIREPLLPAIENELSKGSKLAARSEVQSVKLAGDEAVAMVRREAGDPLADGDQGVVTSHRDTWIPTAEGWRLRESIEVSYHWVMPATTPEAARPVIAELKKYAVPLAGADALPAFGRAVNDARVVALGESARGTREFGQSKQQLAEYLVEHKGFTVLAAANDPELHALADRLKLEFAAVEGAGLEAQVNSMIRLATVTHPLAKILVWTDNAHLRVPALREKLGHKLYSVAFTFLQGEVRAIGVQNGESRGLGTYAAIPSPEGSGDAILSAAGIPRYFLNIAKVPFDGPLAKWLAGTHLFHDLSAYWVLDDPDASLQPEQLDKHYDGLIYVEELHAGQ